MTKKSALLQPHSPASANTEPTAIVRWRPKVLSGSGARIEATNVCRRRRSGGDPREREVTRIWRGRGRGVAVAGRSREQKTLHLARQLFGEMAAAGFPDEARVARPLDAIDLTAEERVIELGVDDVEFISTVEPEAADEGPDAAGISWPTLLAGVALGAVVAAVVATIL